MKRIFYCFLLLIFACGCEKIQPLTGENGIYIDQKLVSNLGSAFAGGTRCDLYQDEYSSALDPGMVGSMDNAYVILHVNPDVSQIEINNLPSIDKLQILLDHGEYNGGNENVLSVKIFKYAVSIIREGQETGGESQINIRIVLKDNRTIDIVYSGVVLFGYFV